MQRVIEKTTVIGNPSKLYLEACRGDVWTLEMKDRNMREIELFAPAEGPVEEKKSASAW